MDGLFTAVFFVCRRQTFVRGKSICLSYYLCMLVVQSCCNRRWSVQFHAVYCACVCQFAFVAEVLT